MTPWRQGFEFRGMRLFRTMLVLGAAGLFLPSPPEDPARKGEVEDAPSTFEMISSAGKAAADAWSFCSRQPEVCGVAVYLGGKLESKALYSASLLWGWTFDQTPEAKPADPGPFAVITVPAPGPEAPGTAPVGQSTLMLDDLVAPWRPHDAAKDG